MSMSEWAENEVKLACKKENPDWDGESFDYGCSCYQSALKAYKSLCADGHSGYSYSVTKNILIRLLNGLPLQPIEDTNDVWSDIIDKHEDYTCYQCKRKSSLFKYVHNNGTVRYSDNDRAYCIDIDTNDTYGSSVVNIIDEMFPITMPYYPPVNQYKIYTKEFIAKGYIGDTTDFNTRAVLYCITPDGEKIEINRYYADTADCRIMKEITKGEYLERLKHIEVKNER